MRITAYINSLLASGRYTFSGQEAIEALNVLPIAARSSLRRLREKGVIARLMRGFYLILPPEYRKVGCMPPEYFINDLMQHLSQTYYVGLLSAAQFHGAAHQQPQQFQVLVSKARSAINCGQARIVFVARENVDQMPTQNFNTNYGVVRVSTPETTVMDLVTYPRHCGGIDYIATVLFELSEKIEPDKLVSLIKETQELTWVQRLGYLFDFLGHRQLSEALEQSVAGKRLQRCRLEPGVAVKKEMINKKWNVWVNVDLELEI